MSPGINVGMDMNINGVSGTLLSWDDNFKVPVKNFLESTVLLVSYLLF